ncbi:hypothetical protein ACFX12_041279 [Malus domestica]
MIINRQPQNQPSHIKVGSLPTSILKSPPSSTSVSLTRLRLLDSLSLSPLAASKPQWLCRTNRLLIIQASSSSSSAMEALEKPLS